LLSRSLKSYRTFDAYSGFLKEPILLLESGKSKGADNMVDEMLPEAIQFALNFSLL
jgi:hypothetical protein